MKNQKSPKEIIFTRCDTLWVDEHGQESRPHTITNNPKLLHPISKKANPKTKSNLYNKNERFSRNPDRD